MFSSSVYRGIMRNAWLRIPLKIALVYFLACTPDMWKLAMLKPPFSIASIVFMLASSLRAPWTYLSRMARGEMEYLPAMTPFVIVLVIGLLVVSYTERNPPAKQ
jgi:hypothetical protein